MSKRSIVGMLFLVLVALAQSACEDSSSDSGFSLTGTTTGRNHRWNLILTNLDPAAATCPTGLFDGLPDVPAALAKAFPGLPLPAMPFSLAPDLEVLTTAYTQQAAVPEIYLLSFSTLPALLAPPPLTTGDQIRIQYTRRIVSDGKDGDFFAVRLTNHRGWEFIEDLTRWRMKNSDPKTITYTTTAQGDFLALDLIVGLSGPADYVLLDDLLITINNVPLITEGFEGPALTAGPYLWLEVTPEQALGMCGITGAAGEVLAGAQSYKFQGGRRFHLYGQSVTQAGVKAAEFNLTDGAVDSTYWQGLFLGVSQDSSLVGNYNGNNFDQSCQENGLFFVLEDSEGIADASGDWAITLTAGLDHCAAAVAAFNDTLFPETAYSLAINQIQTAVGGILQGATVLTDSQGNKVAFAGLVLGDIVLLQATVTTPAIPGGMIYSVAFLGSIVPTETGAALAGTVMGLAMPNPLSPTDTCELAGTFAAVITRP